MIERFESMPDGRVIDTDLCLIGAGAAGIAAALEFVGTSLDVTVLESGELAILDAYEQLNDGEIGGTPFVGLREGRRRGLGGTTAAWGGQCCELDPGDFLARSWVPESGWPIEHADVEPYYRRAEHLFRVGGERYDEANWRRFGVTPVALDPALLRTAFSVFSPAPRLGKVNRKALAAARNLHVVLGATVTNIRTNDAASRATSVDVVGLSGKRASVNARAFVLCAGAVESARLLLASRDTLANGLGNGRDLVGRYFQDHPTSDTALVVPGDAGRLQELYGLFYRGRTWYWPKLALTPERQRETRASNACAFLTFAYDSAALEVLREMVKVTRTGGRFTYSPARLATLLRGAPSVVRAGYRRYILGRSPRANPLKIDVTCTIEQAPNRESRITLADSRDRFGMLRARIDWKISEQERHTFQVMTESVAAEFARLGFGRAAPAPWLETKDDRDWRFWDNYHQTGTTRMSSDPARGVVDPNCNVHGIQGLFVAGAPTFPTSGYANPVLTIAALSIRLSDYLKQSILK
jgi:choline dehydrogenase-like flavoprotein